MEINPKVIDQRIELKTSTTFELSSDEMKRLYTALALFQYQYERTPNYDEATLYKRLCKDFQRFNFELIRLHENDPNNLVLSQIRYFFQCHFGSVKKIVKRSEQL